MNKTKPQALKGLSLLVYLIISMPILGSQSLCKYSLLDLKNGSMVLGPTQKTWSYQESLAGLPVIYTLDSRGNSSQVPLYFKFEKINSSRSPDKIEMSSKLPQKKDTVSVYFTYQGSKEFNLSAPRPLNAAPTSIHENLEGFMNFMSSFMNRLDTAINVELFERKLLFDLKKEILSEYPDSKNFLTNPENDKMDPYLQSIYYAYHPKAVRLEKSITLSIALSKETNISITLFADIYFQIINGAVKIYEINLKSLQDPYIDVDSLQQMNISIQTSKLNKASKPESIIRDLSEKLFDALNSFAKRKASNPL